MAQTPNEEIKNFVLPHHNFKIDETEFKDLLADSLSLTLTEKRKILASFSGLQQKQLDHLLALLHQEVATFKKLDQKHAEKLKQLDARHISFQEQLAQQITDIFPDV